MNGPVRLLLPLDIRIPHRPGATHRVDTQRRRPLNPLANQINQSQVGLHVWLRLRTRRSVTWFFDSRWSRTRAVSVAKRSFRVPINPGPSSATDQPRPNRAVAHSESDRSASKLSASPHRSPVTRTPRPRSFSVVRPARNSRASIRNGAGRLKSRPKTDHRSPPV